MHKRHPNVQHINERKPYGYGFCLSKWHFHQGCRRIYALLAGLGAGFPRGTRVTDGAAYLGSWGEFDVFYPKGQVRGWFVSIHGGYWMRFPLRFFVFGPRGAGAGLSGRDALLHIGPCGQFGANGA